MSRQRPGRTGRLGKVERLEDRTLLSAIYVDATADGLLADGSVEFAFPTIQQGLDLATSGDQVEVAAGRYEENIVMKSGVNVIGAGADDTTLVGRPDSAGVVLFDDVETAGFSGFTIETTDPSHSRSRGVVFTGDTADTAVLERNLLTESMYGVFVGSPARPSIVNNTFDGSGDKQGIYIGNQATDPTIVNNVIVGYSEAGIHVVAGVAAPLPIIQYNDLYRNQVDYLNYPDLEGLRGNVSVNPVFVDPAHADFSLDGTSPLIDLGHPSFGVDPDGTPRDLGAVPTNQVTTQSTTWTFEIDEEFDVPWELFNVTTAGTINIDVEWTGNTDTLKAILTGRRRPDLADPTEPYAVDTGTSPLSLSYDVTAADLEHGPGFRVLLNDEGNPAHDAVGTITVTVPFNETTDAAFQAEKISLLSGDLWPSQELQDRFLADLEAAADDGLHAMVSLAETPGCVEAKDLEHDGIFRQTFLPGRHVFGWIAPSLDLDSEQLAGLVDWITPLEPEDKIDPDLLMENYSAFDLDGSDPTSGNYIVNPDGSLVVTVTFAEDTDNSLAQYILATTTNGAVQISQSGWLAGIDPARVVDVAEFDTVEWVGGPPIPHLETNDTTRMTIRVDPEDLDNDGNLDSINEDTNGNGVLDPGEDLDGDGFLDTTNEDINGNGLLDSVQQPTINAVANTIAYAGLTGNGVNVGIHEGGAIDATHNDLNVVGSVNPGSSAGAHATHVAGIVAASGVQSNAVNTLWNPTTGPGAFRSFQFRGMAPRAGLIDMGQFDTSVTGGVFDYAVLPPADLETAISNFSLDLSNHSHVFTTNGRYDANSVNVDEAISGEAGIPRRPQVFAAGNNGRDNAQGAGGTSAHGDQESLFSVTNETKNSIVVGNWIAGSGRLAPGSSKGPTYDGRIKPDLVAPGSGIVSTATNVNEVQEISFTKDEIATISFTGGVPTAGSFTLTFGGQTTAAIAFNATNATILTALQGLPTIATGDVTLTGGPLPNTAVNVRFAETLANQNVTNMTSTDDIFLNASSQVTSTTGGIPPTQGTFTLSFGGQTTAAIAYNAPNATILTALQGLPTIGAGNVTITGGPLVNAPVNVTFIGTLGNQNVSEDRDGDGFLDTTDEDINGNGVLDPGEDLDGDGFLHTDEDTNNNGVLDPGEDLDGDGLLDANEDTNGNGILDPGEDLDGDGFLDTINEDTNGNGILDDLAILAAGTGLDAGVDVQAKNETRGSSTSGYRTMGGTSMAAPAVSGVTALLLEGWQNTYSTPLGTTIDSAAPMPATLRALLIQSTTDIVMLNEDTNGNGVLDPAEDLDGDGFLDTINEDTDGDGVLDPGEDLDGDGNLDTNEDIDGDGVLDPAEDLDGDGWLDNGVQGAFPSIDVDADSNTANGIQPGIIAATVGPDYATGWGLINAESAVDLVLDSRDEHGSPMPNRIIQDSLQHLEVVEYDFAVDPDMITAGDDVRVTLAWDDVAAAIQNTVSGGTLVNDLDLTLIDPLGNTFFPWQLGHTIRDAAGTVIPSAAQTPGTNIFVDLPFRDEAAIRNTTLFGGNPLDDRTMTLTGNAATTNDSIPADAMMGDGIWVATKGRDHVNNVEVVDIDNVNLVPGHWTLQVAGFDVQDGPQDFAVVGQPHPDLADLVAYSDDKVTIGSLGEDLDLEFTVENVGNDVSESAVQYEIRLSTDFHLGGDVILQTSANNAIPVLNAGDTHLESTTVQITASDVTDLLGSDADFDDLIENDVFLLVRVDSNDTMIPYGNVLENNETNIAFLQMAREVDVVLVMDHSGSMEANVTNVSGGTPIKLDVLQNSASLFLDLMRLDAGDRIAEVAFESGSEVIFSDVIFEDGVEVGNSLVEIESSNLASAKAAVDGLDGGGWTNMTDALLDAYDLLVDLDASGEVIPSDRQKVVVLFSDGMPTAGSPTDPRDLSTAGGDAVDLDSFGDAGIRIYSVGFGTEGEGGIAGIDVDLLEDLANVGDGGFYHVTGSVLDLDKFFVNAVAGAIDSEVIIDPIGSIHGNSEIDASEILVNSQDTRVTFVLTWDNQDTDLGLSVRTPSGVVIGAANAGAFGDRVSLTASDTYRLLEVHMPLSIGGQEEHVGSWTMMVNNSGTETVTYSTSAITQSTIRMDMDFGDPPPGQDYFYPGDPIPLNVKLTGDDRVPLGYSHVSATPIVPIANLNTLLAGAMISEADLAAIPTESNGEPLSELQRMIMAYEQVRDPIDAMVMELDPIHLEPEYQNGEWTGDWTGTFDSTEIPGPYTFVVRAEGCSELCEPFSRELTRTVYVHEGFNPLQTGIDFEMPNDDSVVVTITPTNPDGTVYSPGLDGNDLLVSWGDGFDTSGGIINNLDGSYSFTLAIEDGETIGDLEVWLEGTLLQMDKLDFQAKVDEIEGRPAKFFGEDAALNVAILGQANGVTEVALKPVDNPAWAAPTNELTGNGGLWHLSAGIIQIPATPNQSGNSIAAAIPADLPVGEYTVQLKTTSGLGPIDRDVTYRVIGRGQELPERVQVVDDRLEEFETGQMDGNADWRSMGERLVREVLELPLGKHLTEELRLDAAEVVLQTIDDITFLHCDAVSAGGGSNTVNVRNGFYEVAYQYGRPCTRPDLEMAQFAPLVRAVNLAHIDARFMDEQTAPTVAGEEVDVTLGSGVSLRIGTVSTAGASQVEIAEGDLDVPQNLRSRTHVVYDITTTANFVEEDGVEISLAYEEGDFDSEDNVRLFHKENGKWVDRTTSIDTNNNVVTGLTSSLSPFMMTETPDLSIDDASVIEGNSGTTSLVFTATLSEESFVDVHVDFTVIEVSQPVSASEAATADVDFVSTSGVLTISAGSRTGTISVDVTGDTRMEGVETFQVMLSGAEAVTIVDGVGTGTILDDELSVTFNDTTGSLELTLTAGGTSSITTENGLLGLQVNGNPDPTFPVIAAADVTTILVGGSADDDIIDLSDVSSANGFDSLGAVTVNAGSGNDTIIGSQFNNKINGNGGDDSLTGGPGNDTLNGGSGSDFLVGGAGNDNLNGQGASVDVLSGGPGDDTIDGGAGYDHLFESADVSFTVTDRSLAGLGNDTLTDIQLAQLFGGGSDNVIDGTAFSGRLFLNGSGGNDTLKGGPGADRMFGGSGRDLVVGGEGNDLLRGQGGNQDSLVGGPGNDKLSGGIGSDILDGGVGDDWLRGESGNDTIMGGAGIDQLYEKADVNQVLTDSSMIGGLGVNVLSGIETAYLKGGNSPNTLDASGFSGKTTLIGSGGDDSIVGGSADDLLVGRSGNDTMSGGTGHDTLQGLRGDDMLLGGEGDDVLDGGTQADALSGQDGDDVLYGRAGNDSLVGGDGNDVLWGGEDNDVAVGDDGKDATSSSKDDDTVDAGSGIDTVRGGGGGDTIADSVSEIDETFEFLADWVDGV